MVCEVRLTHKQNMKMKMTINESIFKDEFRLYGRSEQFSSNGLTALYKYFEEVYGEDSGYEYVLDVIGLCCDFTEYDTALEAAKNYSPFTIYEDLNEKEQEKQAVQFLSDNTTIIQFDGGIIIQNF